MASRKSSRSKSPSMRSKSRSVSVKRRSASKSMKKTVRKSVSRKTSPRLAFARQNASAIKAERDRRGLKGIKGYNTVLNEMFLASGGKMMKRTPKSRSPSPRRKASAKRRLAAGNLSPTLEQKLRALFTRGSPSKYSSSGRFKGSKKARKMRSRKVRKMSTRPKSDANKWFAAHKAEINAARGSRSFVAVAWEMYKAAHPNFVAKSKMPKVKKAKKSPKARKARKTSRKGKKSMRKMRKSRLSKKGKSRVMKSRTMKARKGKSRLGRKSRVAKKMGSRKPSAYQMKVKQHMAAARAAHPNMKPLAAVSKYIKENNL
jgi:hypothetical protein